MKSKFVAIVMIVVVILAIIYCTTIDTQSKAYSCSAEVYTANYAIGAAYEHKYATVLRFNKNAYALFTNAELAVDCADCSDITIKIIWSKDILGRIYREPYVTVFTNDKAHRVKPVLLGRDYD